MCRFVLSLIVAGGVSAMAVADLTSNVAKLKATGNDAAGATEAAAAWKQLSNESPAALVPMLTALDGATPIAANWLRSAIDAVVEKAKAAKTPLPAKELEAFVTDTKHSALGRRLAFELVCGLDSAAKGRWLPKLLNDPAPELRHEAVESAFTAAKAKPKDDKAVIAELKGLLNASRSFDQIELIAKELEVRGEKLDLTSHFGFVTKWQIAATTYDNKGGKGFDAVYPPEKGEKVEWKPAVVKEKYAAVDLNKLIGKEKNAVAYVMTEVESPIDQDVEFRGASAAAYKIFVNGKELLGRDVYHMSFTPDSHTVAGKLKKGKNTILIKLPQNDQKEPWAQDWKMQLRITDALGAKVQIKEVTPAS